MARLDRKNYNREFQGLKINIPVESADWPDALTRATFTTVAMSKAVQKASGETRELALGLANWTPERTYIQWESKYLVLTLVLLMSWLITAKWFPLRK